MYTSRVIQPCGCEMCQPLAVAQVGLRSKRVASARPEPEVAVSPSPHVMARTLSSPACIAGALCEQVQSDNPTCHGRSYRPVQAH